MCNYFCRLAKDNYLEIYNNYLEYINKYEDGLFYNEIYDIATEVEYILFQNRDFYLNLTSNRL